MTAFQAPLKIMGKDGITGNPVTDTQGYVRATKVVSLGSGSTASRQIVTLPNKSILLSLYATLTSAVASDVSALNVSWGNSAQASRYGLISVSALGAIRNANVSACTDFESGGTIVLVASAVSTTTFTSGGARAFIDYLVME